MIRRFARFVVTLSEITGGQIPGWAKRVLGPEAQSLQMRERELSRRLRAKPRTAREFPPGLELRIDTAIRAQARLVSGPRRIGWQLAAWSTAAVLCLLVAGLMALSSTRRAPGADAVATQYVRPEEADSQAVEPPSQPLEVPSLVLAGPRRDPWLARLDQPLEAERERLVADLAQAVRVVAGQLVPDRYLPEIDAALDSWSGDGAAERRS